MHFANRVRSVKTDVLKAFNSLKTKEEPFLHFALAFDGNTSNSNN